MNDIAYTLGEPAGIGPDILIQLAQEEALTDIVCIGDAHVLERRAECLQLPLTIVDEKQHCQKGQLRVRHQPLPEPTVITTPSVKNVAAILKTLDTAIEECLSNNYAAMVTGPLHKGIINQSGLAFSGHTEYLAEKTGAALPVMLLATDKYRVALVTTHIPLKAVSAAITEQRLIDTCRIIDNDLREKFGIAKPKIFVAGLNPHAGEGGHLGNEENDTIIPALQKLIEQGLDISGPLPADTLFTPRMLQNADVGVAMYHDQGLPPIKALGFGEAANITLGLPIIRTSVDHGTAFDLAGSGNADIGGLKTAIMFARAMSQPRVSK